MKLKHLAVGAIAILAAVPLLYFAISGKLSRPAPTQQHAQSGQDEYTRLLDEARSRQKMEERPSAAVSAAHSASQPQSSAPAVDPYEAERLIYNLGYQSNIGARLRQDINLLALLVPELRPLQAGAPIDRTYLKATINGTLLARAMVQQLAWRADPQTLKRVNESVINDPIRTYVVEYATSYYDHKNFVDFLGTPLQLSDWRVDTLRQILRVSYLDRVQYATYRTLGISMLKQFAPSSRVDRDELIRSIADNVALYRVAWATRTLSDDALVDLGKALARPDVAAALYSVGESIALVCQQLSSSMDASVQPRDRGVEAASLVLRKREN